MLRPCRGKEHCDFRLKQESFDKVISALRDQGETFSAESEPTQSTSPMHLGHNSSIEHEVETIASEHEYLLAGHQSSIYLDHHNSSIEHENETSTSQYEYLPAGYGSIPVSGPTLVIDELPNLSTGVVSRDEVPDDDTRDLELGATEHNYHESEFQFSKQDSNPSIANRILTSVFWVSVIGSYIYYRSKYP